MVKKKLHIPGPKEESYFGTELSVGISVLVFVFLGFFFLNREAQTTNIVVKDENPAAQTLLKQDKALSRRFEKLSGKELGNHVWSPEDLKAVFLFGPSDAAEIACEKNIEAISSGAFPEELTSRIETAVNGRAIFAPWRCLIQNFLDAKIPKGSLYDEVESFFLELESLDGNEQIVTSVLAYYRENRIRPNGKRFYRWLRRCGVNATYKGGVSCRRFLKTLSPKYGRDVLEALQQSLFLDNPQAKDFQSAVATLGKWSRLGQPKSWLVKSTKNLPAYDIDFRIGAIMSLCRFTMSPGGVLRQQAIDELAKSAEVQMRANPDIQAERWQTTCDLMFGGRYEDDRTSNVLLTRKKVEDQPSYDVAFLIENNFCEQRPGFPTWYCAVRKWIHGDAPIQEAMSRSFIETRFMEFSESLPDPETEDELSK